MIWIKSFFAFILGACLTLAFAPFHWYGLGIFVPALLLLLWCHSNPKQTFRLGWFFGVGFFSAGVYWVYISIHTFGKAPAPVAFFISLFFIATLALFPAAQGWLSRRACRSNSALIFTFPFFWVLFEGLRSVLLTGFPWLLLGYSQMDSVLRHVAPVLSVYGVSFATAIFSSLMAAFFLTSQTKNRLNLVFVFLLLGFGFWGLGYFSWGIKPSGRSLKVSLVQGNIHQSFKWDERKLGYILKKYLYLTRAHWDSDVVVWPEAAVPLLEENAQSFLKLLDKEARQHHSSVILGIPILNEARVYNGIVVLGEGGGTYLKRHLVPFGEYFPFRFLLSFLRHHIEIPMSDMSPGRFDQGFLNVKGVPFSASVCYEIAYPVLIASQLPHAQVLVTLTDDSWFDPSIAQDQQLQMTQMRALETGRYLLAATNDGVTAIIDSRGRIAKTIPASKEGVVTGEVPAMVGSTPWVRLLTLVRSVLAR